MIYADVMTVGATLLIAGGVLLVRFALRQASR